MRNALTIVVLTSLVISLNVRGSFLELDELCDMITDQAIRNDLRRLERDRSDPRSAVKDEVMKLLQKLPENVQDAYNKLVAAEEAKDEAEYQVKLLGMKNRGAPEQKIKLVEEMHMIKTNMTLSYYQVRQQIRALKRSLGDDYGRHYDHHGHGGHHHGGHSHDSSHSREDDSHED